MTRQQFLAYQKAKELGVMVCAANDNNVTARFGAYQTGVFDGILIGIVVFLVLSVFALVVQL